MSEINCNCLTSEWKTADGVELTKGMVFYFRYQNSIHRAVLDGVGFDGLLTTSSGIRLWPWAAWADRNKLIQEVIKTLHEEIDTHKKAILELANFEAILTTQSQPAN